MIVDRDQVAAALPGYELGPQLGRGAFGLVLAAEHRLMGRRVAVKVMDSSGPEGAAVDFAGEVRVLAGLDHPHIVRAYDYVEAGGLCLVVMELAGGGTLTGLRGRLTAVQGCAVGLAVAAALEHAHCRGVLHRDIKADNVLFTDDGTPKVADFGIAKMFAGTSATASRLTGTPLYMAPEQISNGRLGPATDVYALGVLLYQLLAGRPPFDPGQPVSLLWQQHLTAPPPQPEGVPAPLAAVVLRALQKAPADRYRSAQQFAVDLAAAAAAVFGSGWLDHSGIPLHLADDVRQAAAPSASPPEPPALPATGPPQAPTVGIPPPSAAPPVSVPPARRPTRRELLLAAVLTPTAGALGVTAGRLTAPDRPNPPAAPSSSAPAAAFPTTPPPAAVEWSRPAPLGGPLTGHTNTVLSVAFAPNGRLLASGSDDETVRLWDVSDLSRPAPLGEPLTGYAAPVWSVAFSPDGRILATGSDDGRVRLWSAA